MPIQGGSWLADIRMATEPGEAGKADPIKRKMSDGMKYLFDRPALYTTALKFAPLVNLVPECCTHFSNWNAWGIGHAMPKFAKKSFHQLWKEGKVK